VSPLRNIRSLKLKLGIVIVAAVIVAVAVTVFAHDIGLTRRVGVILAVLIALVVVQLLARGMTSRLREMAAAATAMARGEHGQRVSVRGRDEVAELAEAFNAMSAELAETDRQRRELVANVSHELRTPLSALQATLENLIDGVQPPDAGTLEAMHQQVARLGRMVAQLLDLSRMEADEAPLTKRRFGVASLLKRVREEALMRAPQALELEAAATPSDLELVADEERIHQVVTNLVDNAIHFSPPGGTVRLLASAENGVIRLEVADQGPGIPADQRARVFERFYSLDEARSGGGPGLGLAISRWIVEMHGGEISVEEEPADGCRIVVELPTDAIAVGDARG
jgi:signal transduction histidine kinase